MKNHSLALAALLLASGSAFAPSQLPTIEVRGAGPYTDEHAALSFQCGALRDPSPIDVESLLKISDRTQTQNLTKQLRYAIGDACKAGVTAIVVERGKDGRSVTWHAYDAEVVR
jgi:hypothetical protein